MERKSQISHGYILHPIGVYDVVFIVYLLLFIVLNFHAFVMTLPIICIHAPSNGKVNIGVNRINGSVADSDKIPNHNWLMIT